MKIASASLPVTLSGIGAGQTARIDMNPKAFALLSSSVYSDRILAPVRELSCNAIDAHVAAGIPERPITIKLPNNMDPYFRVRDFGNALTPEQANHLYLVYFSSDPDKVNSNSAIGGFGLGSKSPLAYTDSFQVISRQRRDDEKITRHDYIIYKSETGIPCITLAAESVVEASDEPAGLEVMLAVKKDDFHLFQSAVANGLCYLTPQPTVFGVGNFAYAKAEYWLRTESCGIYSEKSRQSTNLVIMGGVAYPLDSRQLNDFKFPKGFKTYDNTFDLFAPIGALSPALNREHLEYNEKTIAALKALLAKAANEVCESLQKERENCKTLWEARLWSRNNKQAQLFFSETLETTWQGQEARAKLDFSSTGNVALADSPEIPCPYRPGEMMPGPRYRVESFSYVQQQQSWKVQKPAAGTHIHETITEYQVNPNLAVIFIDDVKGLRRFSAANRWLRDNVKDHLTKEALIFEDGALTPELLTKIGFPQSLVKLSTVPKDKVFRTPRPKVEKTLLRDIALTPCRWDDFEITQSAESLQDINEGGVYVELCRETHYRSGKEFGRYLSRCDALKPVLQHYKTLFGRDIKIHGVRTADLPRLKKAAKPWVQFDDHLRLLLKGLFSKLARPLALRDTLNSLESREATKMLAFSLVEPFRFSKTSLFSRYQTVRRLGKKLHDSEVLAAFSACLDIYKLSLTQPSRHDQELDTLHRKVLAQYPLLQTRYGNTSDVKAEYKRYIELVDEDLRAKAASEVRPREVRSRKHESSLYFRKGQEPQPRASARRRRVKAALASC